VSGEAGASNWARKAWLIYALATVAGALLVLAIYVNAYDDYDVSERVRTLGRFTRRAMRFLCAPLGPLFGALANPALEKAFDCGDENEPCAVFVDWNVGFFALVAQIILLRRVATK
jgi:hypothetical protein